MITSLVVPYISPQSQISTMDSDQWSPSDWHKQHHGQGGDTGSHCLHVGLFTSWRHSKIIVHIPSPVVQIQLQVQFSLCQNKWNTHCPSSSAELNWICHTYLARRSKCITSRDCLLLFYSSWVNIISLMSWIYFREGSASTAVVLSGVSGSCSTAEVEAAGEDTVRQPGDYRDMNSW